MTVYCNFSLNECYNLHLKATIWLSLFFLTSVISILYFYRISDIASVVAHENDEKKVLYYWNAWREKIGPKLTEQYEKIIQLINKGFYKYLLQ